MNLLGEEKSETSRKVGQSGKDGLDVVSEIDKLFGTTRRISTFSLNRGVYNDSLQAQEDRSRIPTKSLESTIGPLEDRKSILRKKLVRYFSVTTTQVPQLTFFATITFPATASPLSFPSP
jgi:hypothetical protein